ncbi:odorant receptor 131-2-like isoform X1 [Myripristis murdjan]|uniref:odorant receptor 131-2-like isoform X1 n=1 Tax=Myripristis murdjan TaxID=586833 RepID=UPI001175CAEC|nr:odorant receptor 131-2-like isoform X1 [Myripristis murdjan]XP_029906474.1 odorant receptor 131-2-like isoform X1 [Myripristis murdjan]XP_029906475.1 odorant receptor 131-2-like isoform X1 [Myripristis murdjan]XP_029906476.1 odorant receptor 131-2-like isoform X1 [Myripristis murdjan]XP_029906477.1 odorant receptor 131-2-like isoform X1 [Myripristis murdjan]
MNLTGRLDSFSGTFTKNFITFALGLIINCINGFFVHIYFKSQVFQRDPRYVLYIHLVINDIIMLTACVMLHILTYSVPLGFGTCHVLLLIGIITNKNSPLNLAGMAIERYISVCRPLHHTQICTVRRTYALIGLIWAISSISALTDVFIVLVKRPMLVFSKGVICHSTSLYNTPENKAHRVVVQVVTLSFVFLTVIITYLKVFFAARVASTATKDSARKVRSTILLHGVQLLICMLSYVAPFFNLLAIHLPASRNNIYFSSFLVTNVLPRLLSPLIYGVRDQRFSSHIKLYFSCKCCKAKKVKQVPQVHTRFK